MSPEDVLAQATSTALALFADLAFFAPNGLLRIAEPIGRVDRLRIELPTDEQLHLQSLAVVADPEQDVASSASVRASSWHGERERTFDVRRLFDLDHPSGPILYTAAGEHAPWVEVTWPRPIEVSAVVLRNVASHRSARARGIRVLVSGPGEELRTLYDAGQRERELAVLLDRALVLQPEEVPSQVRSLVPVLAKTLAADYAAARQEFDALADLSDELRRTFRSLVSEMVLHERSLQWTIHGPQRCFRFWDTPEKQEYVRYAAQVAQDLGGLTDKVCFGFGAALAAVRDGDLIPHDDDLDLIVGFDPEQAPDLATANRLVEEHLRALGYTVTGNFTAHRHVAKAGIKKLDVFVGLFEGDVIAWYPGRRGTLSRSMMFPTSRSHLLGVTVPLPRNPLMYLEQVYGEGWRIPDPGFKHAWDRSSYADLVRRPGAERPGVEQPAVERPAAPVEATRQSRWRRTRA